MGFWQLAGIVLTVVQMGLHLAGLANYRSRLRDFSDWLETTADANRDRYLAFRARDPDFYNYYRTLPTYSACDSNVNRVKGAAFYRYGDKLRRSLRTNRGYSPLGKVHLNNMLSANAISQAGMARTVNRVKEYKNVDEHILERWSAVVSAPIGVEKYNASTSSFIIQQSFKSLKSAGRGFNSAGVSFGTQLYKVLN